MRHDSAPTYSLHLFASQINRKLINGFLGLGVWEKWAVTANSHEVSFFDDENILKLIEVTTPLEITKLYI